MDKKKISLFVVLALVFGIAIGGTLAWLTDTTDAVKNTFTPSDIDIELTEDEGGEEKEFKMIPGYTIDKDPKATVKAGSEDCYLFVKLVKSANYDKFLDEYIVAAGWTELSGETGVYYRIVQDITDDIDYPVLKDDQLTVKGTVTKEDMNALTPETYPTLTVTAYASQYMKDNNTAFTAAEAWANVENPTGQPQP